MQSNSSYDSSQPSAKKSKKHKNQNPSDSHSSQSTTIKSVPTTPLVPFKPSKTGQMLVHDKSLLHSFSERYDIIKRIRQSRPKSIRTRYTSRERFSVNNPVTLFKDEKRIIDYERPMKPETIIMEQAEERKRRALAARVAAVGKIYPPQFNQR